MALNGLMLHCGADKVDRKALAKIAAPEALGRWCPVPHHTVLEHVEASLKDTYNIVEQAHGLTKSGDRYFGLLRLESKVTDQNNEVFSLVAGVRNSHDKMFPAAIALGASVFVCDNLSFSGEVKIARRHTINIMRDLGAMAAKAVGQLDGLRIQQGQRFDAYMGTELGQVDVHDILVRSIECGIPVTKIPHILKEWREPQHAEFEPRTAWSLFNGYTEVLKGAIDYLPQRTQALHGLFDSVCGIAGGANLVASVEELDNAIEGEVISDN